LAVAAVALLAVPAPGSGHAAGVEPAAVTPHPAVTSPPPDAWPMYGGTPGRSGFTDSTGPVGPDLLWTRLLSLQPGRSIQSSPAVNGTTIITADDFGEVYALDTTTGSDLWNASVAPAPTSPTIANGLVLVGDSDGGVHAFSIAQGTTVWSRTLGAHPIESSLLVENSTVLAETSSGEVGGVPQGEVVALALSTGSTLWTATVPGQFVGAPAFDGSAFYVVTSEGNLTAIDPASGAVRWTYRALSNVSTGPVAADGRLFTLTENGTLLAVSPTGTLLWSWVGRDVGPRGAFDAPPAVDATAAYLTNNAGGFYSVWVANGSTRWVNSTGSLGATGYLILSAPVITPGGLYLIDALERLDDFAPATGRLLWSAALSAQGTVTYSSPAVVDGALGIGDDQDVFYWYATPSAVPTFPVNGTVTGAGGAPIPGTYVSIAPGPTFEVGAAGTFSVRLANGSYVASVTAPYYLDGTFNLTVSGAPLAVHWTLTLVPLYRLSGRVVDAGSFRPLANASVALFGPYEVESTTTTGSNGTFTLLAPNGSIFLSVGPPSGYEGLQVHVAVDGGPVSGVELALVPLAEVVPGSGLSGAFALIALPIIALSIGGAALGYGALAEQRRRAQLPGAVLSPFGRWVTMRILLMPIQILILLAVLFAFGSFLPNDSSACSWTGPVGCLWGFFQGYVPFAANLLTGNWGTAAFGGLIEPVTRYFAWWLPQSIELAVIALGISAALAYPLGLRSGWRPDGWFDTGTRAGTLAGLLLPSFLVILLLLLLLYSGFLKYVGDSPYGTLPNLQWYGNSVPPTWVGSGDNTSPTGFPLIDAALHGAWGFEFVVLMKTLLQALIIALVYVPIFLRYARHAVVERAQSLPILAARARGVPESTLLWRHTAREVLPVYILLFGVTLPMYIGTQSLLEAMFNDTGVGRVLIVEMTNIRSTGFGIHNANALGAGGNLYQVTIFLLLLVVLVSSLLSDILAHYLDPRLAQAPRGR
jgi:outer membrane protein assembly factor BamB/ABC-type dipeptide/oligopeptide/nickel transport system permease component